MSMLPRIGLNLFRLGRSLERSEYMAGSSKAHYLHYLDAASPEYKKEWLESLLNEPTIRQQYFDTYGRLEEEKVLHFIAIDEANPYSIRTTVTNARELARGSRDSLATDLWEFINSFYHAINKFSNTKLERDGFLAYTKKVIQFSLMIKGYIETVMVRDDRWMLLALGFHLERSIQACRLLLHNLNESDAQEGYDERNHLIAMLQSVGSYETYKKLNQQSIGRREALYFLAFNPDFPRSIVYNFYAIQKISQEIGFYGQEEKDAMVRQLSSLMKNFHHQNERDAKNVLFLKDTLKALQELGDILERKYLVS